MTKKVNYKTLYIKLLDSIIKELHDLRYDYDNRIEACGDQSLALMIKEYQEIRFGIEED